MTVRIGIPNRGRLAQLCQDIINNAFGITIESSTRQMVYSDNNADIEIVLFRSTDIPHLVNENIIHVGITGNDYFVDSGLDILEVENLYLLNGLLCLIAKRESSYNTIYDVFSKENIVCYSQYKNLSKKFFEMINSNIICSGIDGAAESYLKLNICDLIIDVVTTGSTYIKNDLKVICPIMPVSSYLYTNKQFIRKNENIFKSIVGKLTGQKISPEKIDKSITYSRFYSTINDINNFLGKSS